MKLYNRNRTVHEKTTWSSLDLTREFEANRYGPSYPKERLRKYVVDATSSEESEEIKKDADRAMDHKSDANESLEETIDLFNGLLPRRNKSEGRKLLNQAMEVDHSSSSEPTEVDALSEKEDRDSQRNLL